MKLNHLINLRWFFYVPSERNYPRMAFQMGAP